MDWIFEVAYKVFASIPSASSASMAETARPRGFVKHSTRLVSSADHVMDWIFDVAY
jgi:hypothetical protein